VQVIYKLPNGTIRERLVTEADCASLAVATVERPWSFDGDGEAFKLTAEAKRIDLAFLFDPMMAVHSSNVDPLPHQITAVYEAAHALEGSIPIVADGGVRHSGDVPKVLVAGADSVMLGSALAGTEESPGEKIIHEGRHYVIYRGMGSLAAMKEGRGSRQRYGQDNVLEEDLVPQGIEGIVPLVGSVQKIMTQFEGGLRATLGYCGSRTIAELQRTGRMYRVTAAGVREAHPHDVKIIKEAPNYRT